MKAKYSWQTVTMVLGLLAAAVLCVTVAEAPELAAVLGAGAVGFLTRPMKVEEDNDA